MAEELHVTLGSVITWDVQGVPVRARITSIREVNWGRFEPNFFAVFQSRALETAVNDSQCREQMVKINMDLAYLPPAELDKVMRAEVARYQKLFANPTFVSRVRK